MLIIILNAIRFLILYGITIAIDAVNFLLLIIVIYGLFSGKVEFEFFIRCSLAFLVLERFNAGLDKTIDFLENKFKNLEIK